MQDPVSEEAKEVVIGSGVGLDNCLENPVGNCLVDSVQDIKDLEESGSVKVEYGDSNENTLDNSNEIGGDDNMVKSYEMKDSSMVNGIKAESVDVGLVKICDDGYDDQIKTSRGDDSCIRVLDDGNSGKFESFGCSIEEGFEKVSLVGNAGGGLVVTKNVMKEKEIAIAGDGNDSDSDSESGSGSEVSSSSSSSSTESSSSSGSDDDDEEEEEEEEKSCNIKENNTKPKVDIEEGEIMGSDSEKMVSWSENDDDDDHDDRDGEDNEFGEADVDVDDEDNIDLPKGPIKSKNELMVLPTVPPVNVTLQPRHQILPVGVVSSILGAQVIVEGVEKHDPLSEGSILWISETRLPLGFVDEIFGPVKNPYYIVRFNSESEVPSGIQNDTLVGFVAEFVGHVLNDKNLYQKGYDASGENDEELFDEIEFSDDEEEAEYRRMMKMSKRGNNNNQGPGNKKKNRKNVKNRERTWTKDPPSSSQAPPVKAPVPSSSHGNPSGPTSRGQNFHARPNAFAQHAQAAGFLNMPGPGPSSSGPSGPNFPAGPNAFAQQAQPSGFFNMPSPGPSPGPSSIGPNFPAGPNAFAHQGQPAGFPNVSGPGPSLSGPSGPNFPGGPNAFAEQAQSAGFLLNGLWANGMPFQQQNMPSFPSGFQGNGMPPWFQQNHPQAQQTMPSIPPALLLQQQLFSQIHQTNPAQCQQPFDLSQLVSGTSSSPLGPVNFSGGPTMATNPPWLGMSGPNLTNQAQFPMFPGIQPNEPQPSQSGNNFPVNAGTRPPFNQGFSSGTGRGRRPFQQRGGRGGGRFGGGRGRGL